MYIFVHYITPATAEWTPLCLKTSEPSIEQSVESQFTLFVDKLYNKCENT
jgi:hypothetical protein